MPTQHLPEALRQRLADEGLVPDSRKPVLLLDLPELHRSHPLVTVLADHLLENALQSPPDVSTSRPSSAAAITARRKRS